MKPTYAYAWRIGAIALALALAGCSDFSQHRFGGVRETQELADGRPMPAPALSIPNPPAVTRQDPEDKVKPATFVPERGPFQLDANPQLTAQPLRVLYQRAAQRHAAFDSYIYRMKRREVVNGTKQPEELVFVKLRREPYSVFLKWVGTEGKGREVVYVRGKYDNRMQVLLAAGDIPFMPAGLRMPIAPDDKLATAKTRYPITETGFGSTIERFGRMVAAAERGDTREGTVKYLGQLKRPEFEQPVEAVHQMIPAKSDPLLPKGGQRWWYFDATGGLPVLIVTHDPDGEVEYYCHDQIQAARFGDDEFTAERLGRK